MSESDSPYKIWMEGGGEVAEKTNIVINGLIREMNSQGNYSVNKRELNKFIGQVIGVHSEQTLSSYRDRLVDHGPFSMGYNGWILSEQYRGIDEG